MLHPRAFPGHPGNHLLDHGQMPDPPIAELRHPRPFPGIASRLRHFKEHSAFFQTGQILRRRKRGELSDEVGTPLTARPRRKTRRAHLDTSGRLRIDPVTERINHRLGFLSTLSPRVTLTIVTIMSLPRETAPMGTWTVAEAKAKFSEVIEQARQGTPQTITRNGRSAAVVVSVEEWDRKTRRSGTLAEFFAESPLHGSELTVERRQDGPREIDL
ncbi:Putative uncharacterized protein [Pararhodospirillum photometricum DSM 122]|uniref:Antitoxin n=2 Tax=Pararhodospirillum photometricum TaxID=1084 RepID=H6SJA2_PARPM|nr:Putative uncharacterized protein [Pararhodospirillum photometricum DSM 122]